MGHTDGLLPCRVKLPPENRGNTLPTMITWTLTAEMRPLPATLGPGGAGRTPDSHLQVKPPAWPKKLLFGTSKLITENRATRWGTAPGPAEGGGAASMNLVQLGKMSAQMVPSVL